MPAKEKRTDTMKIKEVYGPNQAGFYDILVVGPEGDMKLGTKLEPLAAAARGAKGDYAQVTWSSSLGREKDDGTRWTNYYLEGVKGENGDMLPEPKTPETESSKDVRIARQNGIKCAVHALGPIPDEASINEYYSQVVLLAERFKTYSLFGNIEAGIEPPTQPALDDMLDDVPF